MSESVAPYQPPRASLLGLPPELRNQIYNYALFQDIWTYDPNDFRLEAPLRRASLDLRILLTCRQIYQELRLLAFTLVRFNTRKLPLTELQPALSNLSQDQIASIRSLWLDVGFRYFMFYDGAGRGIQLESLGLSISHLLIDLSDETFLAVYQLKAFQRVRNKFVHILWETVRHNRSLKEISIVQHGRLDELIDSEVTKQLFQTLEILMTQRSSGSSGYTSLVHLPQFFRLRECEAGGEERIVDINFVRFQQPISNPYKDFPYRR
ncbi:hypothetical protein M501DRAFT_995982 [Patellaria atrata CBS 101060]|uniref:Uncharacterized protein n=1 Tax=Patellaria atrata CBS 101060 TaxID=1346257 RepID=A0A9P4VPJ8_9PEZI|nr:hypothetical protein M501DRAFT_995982 [Patellaria atrata CBS 101060]